MPILSLELLPWILLAIVVARSVLNANRLAMMREQLNDAHERLRHATAALEARTSTAAAAPELDARREEIEGAVRAALDVVRRDAPQLADKFTKVS
jgi:Asp/Glu/hydantoin racemase